MRTASSVDICGDAERICGRIFRLAANIQDWPALLPHYRYVRLLECSDRHKVADFGASRDGFPVKWRARQELFPEANRITFKHLRGISAGMEVEWRLEKCDDHVHVTIEHELAYPTIVLLRRPADWFAEVIVGRMFVHNIAGKTLRCMKSLVEAEAG
jgi:ribosome-associated toxin RatA of RatAB toxin-antitoxin module